MSVENPSVNSVSSPEPPSADLPRSANYMPCRRCGEGSFVFDPETETSRCSVCDEIA